MIALGRMEPNEAAETLLVAALSDEDPNVRWVAGLALGERGNQKAVGVLVEILRQGQEYDQSRAARYLGRMRAAEAVDALVGALNEDAWSVRIAARDALVEIRDAAIEPLLSAAKEGSGAPAVDALSALLADPEAGWMAAIALGKIGSEKAVTPLGRPLGTESRQARRAAAWALARIPSEEAAKLLEKSANDNDDEVRFRSAD